MSNTDEKLSAILAEIRAASRDSFASKLVAQYEETGRLDEAAAAQALKDDDDYIASLADRIEAAAKRELSRAAEDAASKATLDRTAKDAAEYMAYAMAHSAPPPRAAGLALRGTGATGASPASPAGPARPRRNCDRFDEYHDAVDAWHREERCLGRHMDGGTCDKDLLAPTLAPVCFARWLFAPAEGVKE